jgi:hypothetical protein
MAKGEKGVRSGEIELRIGTPIPTEGTTIRDRNRLMRQCWDAVFALKGEGELPEDSPEPVPETK